MAFLSVNPWDIEKLLYYWLTLPRTPSKQLLFAANLFPFVVCIFMGIFVIHLQPALARPL